MKAGHATRLLITGKPYSDESLIGYVLRLAERNSYESLSWILQLAGVNYEQIGKRYMIAFEATENLTCLARLAGINSIELTRLTSQRLPGTAGAPLHYFFGQAVSRDLIRSNRPKMCPSCLSESPYCRRIWEFSAVTICPTHRRLLIDECPKCKRRISWSRKSVRVCSCKFDWQDSPVSTVVDEELNLTRHIHQLCGLPADGNQQELSGPVTKLSLNDLLRALLFIAGQQRGLSAVTSRHLVAAGKSQNFHNILTEAYAIFENWPINYFRFLDRRRVQERSVTRSYQRMKSALYGEFGSFYSGLHSILSDRQFDFMRIAFIDYITQKQAGGCNLSRHPRRRGKDSLNGPYVLKSDARRLLGVEYPWIDHHIREGQIKTLVQSKGKKRLIFVDLIDITKVKLTQTSC